MGSFLCGLLPILHAVDNTVDSQLVYSKNGIGWTHLPQAGNLIERGEEGSWDEFMITTAAAPIPVGDQLHVYYGRAASHNDWWAFSGNQEIASLETEPGYRVRNGLGLATMRIDGFVSLDASLREGSICTVPMFSTGAHLIINGKCYPAATSRRNY